MRERAPSDRAPPLRIVDKMLRNLWLVGYIDLLVPRARIVHVMRHPLDAGRGGGRGEGEEVDTGKNG
jgi:hypothetical protein